MLHSIQKISTYKYNQQKRINGDKAKVFTCRQQSKRKLSSHCNMFVFLNKLWSRVSIMLWVASTDDVVDKPIEQAKCLCVWLDLRTKKNKKNFNIFKKQILVRRPKSKSLKLMTFRIRNLSINRLYVLRSIERIIFNDQNHPLNTVIYT